MKLKEWWKRRKELKELKRKFEDKIKKEGNNYMLKSREKPYGY